MLDGAVSDASLHSAYAVHFLLEVRTQFSGDACAKLLVIEVDLLLKKRPLKLGLLGNFQGTVDLSSVLKASLEFAVTKAYLQARTFCAATM